MFDIKCPECKANTKGLLRDYLQWRSDKRICPHCGAQLEISNAIFCFGLCGLILGVIISSSHYWDIGNEWLRLVTALLICWMILPVIVRTAGRWQVLSDEQNSKTIIQKWSRIIPVSLLALAIAFTTAYCVVRITFFALDK